jgi:CheY-like chemotaxis protein
VADTGCGISPDNLNRIFEPFFTTRELGEGTGLGLAAAYGTLIQYHGSITVSSEVSAGTIFTILLPLIEEKKKKDETPAIVHQVCGSGKILLVDDEAIIRETVKSFLEDFGYKVVLAENGVVGLDIFKKMHRELDLVIMDMMMPEMNGEDCFNIMRSIDPTARIIISSGFTRDADIEKIKNKGLIGILRKPFRLHELVEIVSKEIDKK